MSAVLAFFARLPWWAWVGVALLAVLGWQWLAINRLESALSEEEEAHIATTAAFTTYRANVESLATAEKLGWGVIIGSVVLTILTIVIV